MSKRKVVLVTGSTSGIGLGIAKEFALNGYDIGLNGLGDAAVVEAIKRDIEVNFGAQVFYSDADMAKPNEIERFVKGANDALGAIDVLINNAGVIRDRSFLKMTREEWDVVMSVNVDSLFITAKAVVPHMKAANYGRIISASSINAYQGAFGQANYCASKAAIVGFTHSLCKEVGKYNITVNAVAPGFIKSEMSDSMPEEVIKAGIAMIPVKRIGTPEDMGYAYLFLASKEAGFVSGHTLHANGGSMPS